MRFLLCLAKLDGIHKRETLRDLANTSVFGSSVEQEKSATALRFHMVAER